MWIVKLALNRPYTFIVLALLILLLSPVIILRTPTDIFPNINIPVISVGWTYTGLNPEEMEGRLTTPYEKAITTLVDNVEHTESTTYNGVVGHQDLPSARLQPRHRQRADHRRIPVPRQAASSRHPASADHQLLRVQRAHPAARRLRQRHDRAGAQRHGGELHPPPAHHRARRSVASALRRQAAPGPDQHGPGRHAGPRHRAQRPAQRRGAGERRHALRHRQDRPHRIRCPHQRHTAHHRRAGQHPHQTGQRHHHLSARYRQRQRRLHRADQHRPPGWPSRRAHHRAQERQRLHPRRGQGNPRPAAARALHRQPQCPRHRARRSVRLRARRGPGRHPRGHHRRRAHRADDPALPRQLAVDAHHCGLHSAVDPHLRHRPLRSSARPSTP